MGVVLALGAAATMVVLLWPDALVGVRHPVLHATVETAASTVALLAALLAGLRLARRKRLPDLVLLVAFTSFGLTNLLYSTLTGIAETPAADAMETWAALAGRLLSAALFAAASLVPDRPVASIRAAVAISALPLFALLVTGLAAAALADWLPLGVGLVANHAGLPAIRAHPLLASAQGLSLGLYAVAAVAFWRRARRGDQLSGWLAAAAALAAVARLHYLLYPSLYAGVIYSGDFLRLGFYGLLLAATAQELAAHSRYAAHAESLEERHRLAHMLHDGLAQELAVVSSQARGLARSDSNPRIRFIASAAERALNESRRAIAALSRAIDEPLDASLAEEAGAVAMRLGVAVSCDLDRNVCVDARLRETVLRIAREALTNSARHARANEITVELRLSEGLTLRVVDDGVGFDPDAVDNRGLGMASMRESTEASGGRFAVSSEPAHGTIVDVRWPWDRPQRSS